MAKQLLRHDSQSHRKYIQSLLLSQQERRKADKHRIAKDLYWCRNAESLGRILKRAGVIDENNVIISTKGKTSLSKEGEKEVQNFHHVQNALFYDISTYRPLNFDRHEIRLVELLPSNFEDPLRCILVDQVSLYQSTSPYHALSYAVGDVSNCASIELNGSYFRVSKNLEAALRHIRRRDQSIRLWVDQICINQLDHAERAEQVMLMCEIYSKAYQTYAWLGTQPEFSEGLDLAEELLESMEMAFENMSPVTVRDNSALDTLLEFVEKSHNTGQNFEVASKEADYISSLLMSTELINIPVRQTQKFLSKITSTKKGVNKFAALVKLAYCEYWQRSWIWQEVSMSVEPLILCGLKRMYWHDFIFALRLLNTSIVPCLTAIFERSPSSLQELRPLVSTQMGNMKPIELHVVRETWLSSSINLRQILSISRKLKSTDQRDKVFGVLSMVSDAYRITPEYHNAKTLASVFLQTTLRSILVDDNLDIMSDGQETNKSQDLQLPSWVPDFSVFNSRRALIPAMPNEREKKTAFNATPGTLPNVQVLTQNGSTVLRLSGIVLGKPLISTDLGPSSGKDAIEKWTTFLLDRCPSAAQVCLPATSGESMLQSLGRTAVFDLDQTAASAWLDRHKNSKHEFVRNSEMTDHLVQLLLQLEASTEWRFLFRKTEKIMGSVPSQTAAGDSVIFIIGSKVPFVIRRSGLCDSSFRLIGPCYIHGYINGRILSETQQKRFRKEKFNIY